MNMYMKQFWIFHKSSKIKYSENDNKFLLKTKRDKEIVECSRKHGKIKLKVQVTNFYWILFSFSAFKFKLYTILDQRFSFHKWKSFQPSKMNSPRFTSRILRKPPIFFNLQEIYFHFNDYKIFSHRCLRRFISWNVRNLSDDDDEWWLNDEIEIYKKYGYGYPFSNFQE